MVMKTLEQAKSNLSDSIGNIPARYEAGVKQANWRTAAANGEDNYKSAMNVVLAKGLRRAGIEKVSDEEWRDAAAKKGAPIIGSRLQDSLGKWEANWGPMYQAVQSKVNQLPGKGIDFRQNITNRLIPVVEQWKKSSGKT